MAEGDFIKWLSQQMGTKKSYDTDTYPTSENWKHGRKVTYSGNKMTPFVSPTPVGPEATDSFDYLMEIYNTNRRSQLKKALENPYYM